MKMMLIGLLLFNLSGHGYSFTASKSVTCFEKIEQSGVHATIKAEFSEAPFLRDITTIDDDGSPDPVETIHLSANKVCGLDIQFAKTCRLTVRNSEFDYHATFTCQGGLNGEILLDEKTLSFSCGGPGVPMHYRNGVNFWGCELHR